MKGGSDGARNGSDGVGERAGPLRVVTFAFRARECRAMHLLLLVLILFGFVVVLLSASV
jgi:hypothetical protein